MMAAEIVRAQSSTPAPVVAAAYQALANLTDAQFDAQLALLAKAQERAAAVKKVLMRDGVHYGLIPGTGKRPSLLKPGAEVLLQAFGLVADYAWDVLHGDGVTQPAFQVIMTARIHVGATDGPIVGVGVAEANSWEKRNQRTKSGADPSIPYDLANTIVKMAKKRALIDATLTSTASSDLFTQDMEPEETQAVPRAVALIDRLKGLDDERKVAVKAWVAEMTDGGKLTRANLDGHESAMDQIEEWLANGAPLDNDSGADPIAVDDGDDPDLEAEPVTPEPGEPTDTPEPEPHPDVALVGELIEASAKIGRQVLAADIEMVPGGVQHGPSDAGRMCSDCVSIIGPNGECECPF